jgi:hypothetical protein
VKATRTEIIAAWVRNRAHRYSPRSGIHDALLTLAWEIQNETHIPDFNHGELDDLIKEIQKGKKKRAKPCEGDAR